MQPKYTPPFYVYVARPGTTAATETAPGTAFVSRERATKAVHMVPCYYEGNLYDSENLRCFEQRAYHAAGRLAFNYPTVAQGAFLWSDLEEVGAFTGEKLTQVFEPAGDIARWSPSLAALIERVSKAHPDLCAMTDEVFLRRISSPLNRMMKHVHIPPFVVTSSSHVTPSNPTGYVGGGDCRETAYQQVAQSMG